eukprot:Gb_24311 [translate_table: standard]
MKALEEEKFTLDGSVGLRGRPVLRAKTGGLKACSFIVGYEFCERLAFAGIFSNLLIYLTTKLHEGTVSSSRNVSNWAGTIWVTPLLGAYIADTHLGRYWTFIVFSFIYILGMGLLTLAVSLSSLKPPPCTSNNDCERASTLQIGIFYFGLYVLAVGSGGTKPNISTFGADQFDDFDPKEKNRKNSFFNWWMFGVFIGALLGQTCVVYVQDHAGWGAGYGIALAGLVISTMVFLLGTPFYRHKVRVGSPLQRMAKVIIGSARNRKLKLPSDPSQLYEVDIEEYAAQGRHPVANTRVLRFLDKAAIKDGGKTVSVPCTVTQVEETKLMMGMLPIWLATIIPSTMLTQISTLFVKQAMTLDRHIGPNFEIPTASVTTFATISLLISMVLYDRFLIPIFRRFTGNPRGITILQRMGIGLVIHIVIMVVAMTTEIKRLNVVKDHGLAGNRNAVLPRSVFTLLPQFVLMGIADTFVDVGKLEFFYDQAPENMQSLGTALFTSSLGLGSFMNSVLLTVVSNITGRNGHSKWILDNLNASRLDYYYAFLSVLNVLNLLFFLFVSYCYVYKRELGSQASGEDFEKVIEINVAIESVHDDHKNQEPEGKAVGGVLD